MGHRTFLEILRKRKILAATVFELRTFQPENRKTKRTATTAHNMKPEVQKAVTLKFLIFCDVTSCSLAVIYKGFERSCYLHLQNKSGTIKSRNSFEMPLKCYQTARRHTLKDSNPRPEKQFSQYIAVMYFIKYTLLVLVLTNQSRSLARTHTRKHAQITIT
jgi:hypothetical protein